MVRASIVQNDYRYRRLMLATLFTLAVVSNAVLATEDDRLLRLAATTTSENSGLLERLIPAFETDSGYRVRVIIGSSGRALKLLTNGDVDIALTHAPGHEQRLLRQKLAVNHTPVMYNDFVIVGPDNDPAHIGDAPDAATAFQRIKHRQAIFLSRGDESGTHEQERSIWQSISIKPQGSWYRETGQGMGHTLLMANELTAYTLSDRATWLVQKNVPRLALHFDNPQQLRNLYALLSANPTRHPHTNSAAAKRLSEWFRASTARKLITDYVVNGQALFVPLP